MEFLFQDEDFSINTDYNSNQQGYLFFFNNDNKILKEIFTEIDLAKNEIKFNKIHEKKIKTNFKVQQMQLINYNFSDNKNFLLFSDLYNIYKMNIKSIHENLQENATKLITVDEVPICYVSNVYLDKLFSISSDDEFIKNDINNINSEVKYIPNNIIANNYSSHNKLSLIDFNTGKIIYEINLSLYNSDNIYKKGHFLNSSNIALIYSKNKLSLLDFRYKKNKLNNLLPDYNFNFNDIILFDQFQYMTLSPHKISLFDLRYPSFPKTEKAININYKELQIKKNKHKDNSYILFDKFKNDSTFIKLEINEKSLNSPKILENFAEFKILNNNNSQIFIHDIIGFVHQNDESDEEGENEFMFSEDKKSLIWEEKDLNKINISHNSLNINETYFCFILDNLDGIYMNIYDINNTKQYMGKESYKEEKEIQKYIFYDQIFNIYKNYYKDLPYVSTDEENNLYWNRKEQESEKGFGYVKINKKDKKMYEIVPKRYIFKEALKSFERKDINPQLNFQNSKIFFGEGHN